MALKSIRIPSISIRYALPGLFVTLIIVTVGLTGWLAFRSGQRAVNSLATRLRAEIAGRIERHVLAYMDAPQLVLQLVQANVQSGNLDLKNFPEVERNFWNQLHLTGATPNIYFGNEQGDFMSVGEDGERLVVKVRDQESAPVRHIYTLDEGGQRLDLIESNEYDPRIRPWYNAAKEAGKGTWSSIYPGASPPVPQITAVIPVYNETGDLHGVLAADLTLVQISNFLQELQANQPGQTFIIERSGEIVASSTNEPPYVTNEERLKATASQESLIRATAQQISDNFGGFEGIQGYALFIFNLKGENQYVEVSSLQDEWGLDWLIVVVIPEKELMGPIYENVQSTLWLGLLILAVAVAIGWVMARWIIQPILTVTQAAAAIESSQFELNFLEAVAQRQDEFGQLARVFQRMAREVYAREQQLKQQLQQLHIEIDEAKRQQQVKEIVDTDFFADLQAKAQSIRQRREHGPRG
jgi:HAMP domain-containing protein